MGRCNRERIARIEAGEEVAIRDRASLDHSLAWVKCNKCGHLVTESAARRHIKECWGKTIREDELLPVKPPKQ